MKQKHIHRIKNTTKEMKTILFGDLDLFDFGNIVMACTAFSTLASLALYMFCFYCI